VQQSPTAPGSLPLKPQPVAESAPAKPIPQATIKLQAAPAPAIARKPIAPVTEVPADGKKDASAPAPKKAEFKPLTEEGDGEDEVSSGAVPLPFLLAAAALALLAFAIQLWTYLS
jgi:hypothetical protein